MPIYSSGAFELGNVQVVLDTSPPGPKLNTTGSMNHYYKCASTDGLESRPTWVLLQSGFQVYLCLLANPERAG